MKLPYNLKSVYVKYREFYKDIAMERNNKKTYMHTDTETGSNEIFVLIDKIENDTKNVNENILEGSDTECIVEIAEVQISNNKEESH